ncbi:uncharacterized protein AMSG_04127 [Thecamonas trahens ATCC 50062]|uniref:Transmembrane protein n=1 Tax=Thecamonas trahens ATCC 50062 TaxID=461836 RepID=A0A0L0D719_THETB|nr:hypothetical protein AMSG_04127 [Thecamonas trahens ATCC 50062]KNC47896.1 hypothetical protein AMSG_04127 [Thecamonas trahens ATCC 50062]|eukprot:XP_013758918.1 hypothetical protein AMSG_04127 [Thecamonas trahens ATCC 50062]
MLFVATGVDWDPLLPARSVMDPSAVGEVAAAAWDAIPMAHVAYDKVRLLILRVGPGEEQEERVVHDYGDVPGLSPLLALLDINVGGWGSSLMSAAHTAVGATAVAVGAWLRVLGLVALPLVLGYVYVAAHGYVLARVAWESYSESMAHAWWWLWHQVASQPPAAIALEVGVAVVAALLWGLARFVRRTRIIPRTVRYVNSKAATVARGWQAVTAVVAARSRTLADSLPHVVFWGGVAGGAVFAPSVAFGLTSSTLVRFVTLALVPVGLAARHLVQVLHAERGADQQRGAPARSSVLESCSWLEFWAVYGGVTLALAVPFVESMIVAAIGYELLHLLHVAVVLWALLPWTNGSELGARALVPVLAAVTPFGAAASAPLRRRANSGGMLGKLRGLWESLSVATALNALTFMGVMTAERARMTAELLAQASSLLLITPIFLFTPGFITYYGTVLVGYAVPLYATLSALGFSGGNRGRGGSPERRRRAAPLATTQRFWVLYWTVFVGLDFVHHGVSAWGGSYIPLWYHVKLVALVWLQLAGASYVFTTGYSRLREPVRTLYDNLVEATPLRNPRAVLATPSTYMMRRVFGTPEPAPVARRDEDSASAAGDADGANDADGASDAGGASDADGASGEDEQSASE